MSLTIAYFTSRNEPHFDWFADSLCNQTTDAERAEIQVLIIDRLMWYPALFNGAKAHTEWINLLDPMYHNPARRMQIADAVKGRFAFTHIPPKPNIYQGPWRLTSKDWFCAANSRNTAFLFAKADYFVGVDDLTVLLPGWMNQVRHAAEGGYCVCGAYKKVKQLNVVDGNIVSFEEFPGGVDSRWGAGTDAGVVPWHGSGLYGCSFGVPLALAMKVDGFAPECNAIGAEDYDFGIRAERAGGRFFYNRNMCTYESEEGHHLDPSLPRESREVIAKNRPANYAGNPQSDHVLLNRVNNDDRVTPFIPERLIMQRARLAKDGMVNVPREPLVSWIDDKPLSEL